MLACRPLAYSQAQNHSTTTIAHRRAKACSLVVEKTRESEQEQRKPIFYARLISKYLFDKEDGAVIYQRLLNDWVDWVAEIDKL